MDLYFLHMNVLHIGDADGLIAMVSKNDASHEKAREIIKRIVEQEEQLLFPATAVTEAITTLQVRLQNPELAKLVAEAVTTSKITIVPVDAEILKIAVALYNPSGSRKNTMFDATIAATANKYNTKTIFSFDGWYRKIGFTLLGDLL